MAFPCSFFFLIVYSIKDGANKEALPQFEKYFQNIYAPAKKFLEQTDTGTGNKHLHIFLIFS
jgi:hypothetical protein